MGFAVGPAPFFGLAAFFLGLAFLPIDLAFDLLLDLLLALDLDVDLLLALDLDVDLLLALGAMEAIREKMQG